MKPAPIPFDEKKLTPAQREALAITKSQGKKIQLKRHELVAQMEPEIIDDLLATVMEIRKQPTKQRDID